MGMKQWSRRTGMVVWGGAIAMLVIAWILSWFLTRPTAVRALWYVGWVVWVCGAILIILPLIMIYGRSKSKGWIDTIPIVDSGIYSLVRHPLYLGWLLMYVVVIFYGQHWIPLVMGIAGIACVYLISVQEDMRLVVSLGDDYVRYMQKTPRMNILLGLVRVLQRRKK
jgi:protein-S-isoprenylcysteine O-methyltransferase Ste14